MAQSIHQLINSLPHIGKVEWIGLRPERRAPIEIVNHVIANTEFGLVGDRYAGRSGKRQVTLIQHEHLAVIAALLGLPSCEPETLRHNIAISGINLLALKGKTFTLGEAALEYTGLCHPCSFMEKALGPGGYNAVRGHGGITARVLKSGSIRCNNSLRVNPDTQ